MVMQHILRLNYSSDYPMGLAGLPLWVPPPSFEILVCGYISPRNILASPPVCLQLQLTS